MPQQVYDIYVRVSRVGGRGGENFISPELQEQRCRAEAQAKGYKVGQVFTDLDQSGRKMDRPAFEEAMARVESGKSAGIIVARLDRFARSVAGAGKTLERLEAAGGSLVACDVGMDTSTPAGGLMRNILLALAEFESERIKTNWKDAHEKGIEGGRYQGAAPAGYIKVDGILVPDPVFGPVVTEAFRMRADGGNFGQVARYLTEQALPTRNGKTDWQATSVRKLISNKAYLGIATFGDIVNDDAHPALTDEITFRRANRKEARMAPDRKDGKLLGSGLCRCGTCGAGMVYGSSKAGDKTYTFLRCRSGRHVCPQGASIMAHALETWAIREAASKQSTWFAGQQTDEAETLRQAVVDAEGDLAEVEALKGTVKPAAYAVALSDAQETLETAQAAWMEALPGGMKEITVDDLFHREITQDVLGEETETLVPMDVVSARAWLKAQLGSIVVQPGRATIQERVSLKEAA